MNDSALKTLFYPFNTDLLPLPGPLKRILFLEARAGNALPSGWQGTLVPVQGFLPYYQALENAGFQPSCVIPDGKFDTSLILCGKHRGRNEANFSAALQHTVPGGAIVVAGEKASGIASFYRRVSSMFSIENRVSKYHGVAFWLRRPAEFVSLQTTMLAETAEKLVDGRYYTAAGMFSHDRVDPGSQLLAMNLPQDLRGSVADFAAGWGYISERLLQKCPGVEQLDLYEADYLSLKAAKRNIESACQDGHSVLTNASVQYHWHDLRTQPSGLQHDGIVMNPPFHEGRRAEPSIGEAMISSAAASLKRGGRLFMVANRHLDYERVLQSRFGGYSRIADDGKFKVLLATWR